MVNLLRSGRFWVVAVAMASTLAVAAQEAGPRALRGRLRDQGGVPLKKIKPDIADPLEKGAIKAKVQDAVKAKGRGVVAKPEAKAKIGAAPFHYTFKFHSFDGAALSASYYPSKLGSTAPVLILVHEANRSRNDFEAPVLELKGQGLAEYLQDQGYASFSFDLRNRGQELRRGVPAHRSDGRVEKLSDDLQAVYQFLLDRHNRGELNVAKLGVLGVGEGANLVAAWAHQPGAAVSTEGRAGDINDMILVSPEPEGAGYQFDHVAGALATRIPMLLMVGERDKASNDAVAAARAGVERSRLNKIELFPSSLHGFRLLRLEPKVANTLIRHLDSTLKLRPGEWEPRYNQFPIAVTDVRTVQRPAPEPPKAEEPKKKADEPPKVDEPEKENDEQPKAAEPEKKAG